MTNLTWGAKSHLTFYFSAIPAVIRTLSAFTYLYLDDNNLSG